MSDRERKLREEADRLADELSDEILAMSDEDIADYLVEQGLADMVTSRDVSEMIGEILRKRKS